ncbi:MAG: NTPase KAP [Candidatus Pacebacteria bacterium]|nr:NTPase KAP [Candidatus Paceibacterota bacterium]PIR63221.1 MAG: NTPase KAP [Candidatus Pacebacteria bacterium CG10_big_fil_rev_8_21_14_0_10_40_26]PIZ78251.1 MAG: NTPase KAP [Candidatus Pacebacteria bacterium CG_4_10_14_0_2_um_filter_40_20]PJA68704.1 MAG: NTPase KAP [Candidatus Pacebacteria bacterium CG_4_9_14_3_um_filter_40_12]PJC41644.1 MAG: NTPase KAP [Candidatus Pacebacteria bacterium CG_4_9_14_0_2_um_filter_40_15]
MIIPDNETAVDLLNNQPIANNIVDLLKDHMGEPITIGVHGDWGAGKSSVLEMIEASFINNKDGILCLRFDGWRFQGFEDAKIALIEGIVTGLLNERSLSAKSVEKIKNLLKRVDWLKLAKHGGGLAVTAFTGLPNPDHIRLAVTALKTLVNDPGAAVDKEKITAALESADGILRPAEEVKRIPEEIQAFRKEFDDLLEESGINQLVVLIDDLDRCLPKTVIETLEAIRLFVFTSRTAFIVAADEGMIEYSVREHFPDLPESTNSRDYARNYLEKLVQVPFRLPSLGELETKVYVSLLLIGSELGEDDSDFLKLAAAAKEVMRKPWEESSLEIKTINETLGEKAKQVTDIILISEQIGHSLAGGTNGNPRQIKRFLNTLLLRKEAAEARGFGDEIALPILAKLMLAERFIPGLFDRIAQTAAIDPTGVCPEIASLETSIKNDSESEQETSTPQVKTSTEDEKSTPEWLDNPEILAWARIEPPLAKVDLRPYLFIAKERKDYFAGAAISPKLSLLAEKLMGGELGVQGQSSQVSSLAPEEQVTLFDLIRGRTMRSGNFAKKPDGIEGLKLLSKNNTALETKLVDFLDTLPTSTLGPWCIGGWDTTIKETGNKARLATLVQGWAEVNDNRVLSSVAKQAVNLPKKGK